MKKGEKAGIVCCSNAQPPSGREKIQKLTETLLQAGIVPVYGRCIWADAGGVSGGSARERAEDLMRFYRDEEITAIFDISGGDVANEILPFLDFQTIAGARKLFWGYSDLTTILNAVYTKTGRPSVLYQIRNLIRADAKNQLRAFTETVFRDGQENFPAFSLDAPAPLFDFRFRFIQGTRMRGTVVGGNIRCFLKLAGTPYWPDMRGKILLLEAWRGGVPQMITFLSQLEQMGVFEQVSGLLLGTFTQMQEEACVPSVEKLAVRFAGARLPVAKTEEIGHGADSRAILIGREIELSERFCYPPDTKK